MADAMLQGYLNHIELLDREDSPILINNSSIEHAIPLVARLIARGQREISLLTGSLNPLIYADRKIVDALGVFLIGRSGFLRILVEKGSDIVSHEQLIDEESGLISVLRAEYGESALSKVEIRRGGGGVSASGVHYLVIDEKGFRFEPDNTKHEAIASFNRPETASRLRGSFDGFFDDSEIISIH